MAITVPSQTVETFFLIGNNTAFSVDVPTDVDGGIQAGDYIIVIAVHSESEDNDWSPVPPSGMDGTWVDELQVGQTPPSIPGVHVFYELCSGGESGSRTMTADFAGSMSGICFVVRGVDTTTPLDVAVQTVQSTSVGDPDPPAITPVNDDCLILAIGLQDDTNANPLISYPTNYTGLAYIECTESTGHNIGAAYRILSGGASQEEDPGIFDVTNTDEWAGATIALRPGISGATYNIDKNSDARILKVGEIDKNSDARILVVGGIDKTSDARVKDTYEIDKNSDARIKILDDIDKYSNALIEVTPARFILGHASMGVIGEDALGISGAAVTHNINKTSDARIFKTSQIDKTSDAKIVLTSEIDKYSDARVKATLEINKYSDARIKNTYQVDKTSDARVVLTYEVDKYSDARIKNTYEVDKTSDARIKDTYDIDKTSDATIVNTYDIDKTSDARIFKTSEIDKLSDARILRTEQIDKTSDARVVLTYEVDKYSDARIKATLEIDKNTDARVLRVEEIDKNSDTRILRVEEIDKTSDARVFKTSEIDKTSDAKIVTTVTYNVNKTSDATIWAGQTRTQKDRIYDREAQIYSQNNPIYTRY